MNIKRQLISRRTAMQTGVASALALTFAGKTLAYNQIGQAESERSDEVGDIENPEGMRTFIEGMPKAELHMHLEGSADPDLTLEIAARNDVPFPYQSSSELKRALSFDSLETFLKAFAESQSVLLTGEDFYDVTLAYLAKVRSQNVIYAEMKFDPQAHTRRGVNFESVVDGIHSAQNEAQRSLGIKSQLIMCFQRDASIESANQELDNALRHKDKIVGIGLDNSEIPMFPLKFSAVFDAAREEGFKLTSHCDVDVPNSIEHIRACIETLQVDRLDHGINILESDGLTDLFRERQTCLTACPTSGWNDTDALQNPYLQRVAHGVQEMLARGLCVTVNTDDPGLMGGRYMNEIMTGTQKILGLDKKQLSQLMRNAFRSLWTSSSEQATYLKELDNYLASNSVNV